MFGWKKSSEKSDSETLCPYCKRHCTKDHLRCDKGKEYFNIPLGKHKPSGSGSVSSTSGSSHHHHHHSGSSSNHASVHSNIPNYSLEELDAVQMTQAEMTYALLCKWRYFLRDAEKYGSVDANVLFASLTDEETQTLNTILRRFVESWEQTPERF